MLAILDTIQRILIIKKKLFFQKLKFFLILDKIIISLGHYQ